MIVPLRPRVTVVIVTYNSRDRIDAALRSQHEGYESGFTSCVVVDNDSRDGTADHVDKTYPWVTLVKSPINLGFGRGCNLGARGRTSDYVLFLNPDAVLPLAELKKLVAFADKHPKAGILAPAIRDLRGWQHCGGLPTPWRLIMDSAGFYDYRHEERAILPSDGEFQTDWVCGAILMVRRSAFEQLKGFEPRYFLYFEETDLCRRAQDAGIEIWAVGSAVGDHTIGASSANSGALMYHDCIAEHFLQSRSYYLRRHFGLSRAVASEVAGYCLVGFRAVLRKVRGRKLEDLGVRLKNPIFRMPPVLEPSLPLPSSSKSNGRLRNLRWAWPAPLERVLNPHIGHRPAWVDHWANIAASLPRRGHVPGFMLQKIGFAVGALGLAALMVMVLFTHALSAREKPANAVRGGNAKSAWRR